MSPDVVETPSSLSIAPIVTSPGHGAHRECAIDTLDVDITRDGHQRRLARDRRDRDVSAGRLHLQIASSGLEPDVAGRRAGCDLAELAFDTKICRPASELEVGARRAA